MLKSLSNNPPKDTFSSSDFNSHIKRRKRKGKEMPVDRKTRAEIEKKSLLFEEAKEEIQKRVEDYIKEGIKKLKEIEKKLLDEVGIEFKTNPFADLLGRIDSDENVTDEEFQSVKSEEILTDFGPTKESFRSLCDEIEAFGSWRDKTKKRKRRGIGEPSWSDFVPKNIKCTNRTWDSATLSWDAIDEDYLYEVKVGSPLPGVKSKYCSDKTEYTLRGLEQETRYTICVRSVDPIDNRKSMWSNPAIVQTMKRRFDQSEWKKIPNVVGSNNNYSVDMKNPRIATKMENGSCTVIGDTPLPLNKVTSWNIKILKSRDNNGGGILIGVAPSEIDQNENDNYSKCGWYFYCYRSTLVAGPPHNYVWSGREYGPRKEYKKLTLLVSSGSLRLIGPNGKYVQTGDSVGVVMNTANGELSFVVNGVNLGVAYEGIPLDKPLVPCVLLKYDNDSIELVISEMKENEDSSIPVPFNITTKKITWDSITLTWDAVEGASFYQIEVDGNILSDASTTNVFTKKKLSQNTAYSFRVRAARENSVSEWSDILKWRTQKESFETSGWKECPDDVDGNRKYSVDVKNPRIATKIGGNFCTIIGNTPLPFNKITSWSIKILHSENNNGSNIFIGVAPSNINQNEGYNYNKCGWYFHCYDSQLFSGPPHNYSGKVYGPRKGKGEYIHTDDSVGVVMDTTKGELSLVVNGVNLGVAYEGIPLDKPLVPCVPLYYRGDSVELDGSEVKETAVDTSIPVPSNITTKSFTSDSITLTWDAVEGASFYQIEVDGNILSDVSVSNVFTKKKLSQNTAYSFRVRAVRENSVSGWSDIVKWGTQKAPDFTEWGWKECPNFVNEERKYSVDENNRRIAKMTGNVTRIDDKWINTSTILLNCFLSFSGATSWNIKILTSWNNDGGGIFIGVAPFDIKQNEDNSEKCGWYFNCYASALWSGPPHNYRGRVYGPRKEKAGEYVRTGDIIGVTMDVERGELSFTINEKNLGVAYKGIPLDKPLVPCVILYNKDDSIELVI